jgi:membrane glycosyltransferase
MKMRQSLAAFEDAFHEAKVESVVTREELRREAAQRSRQRRKARVEKSGKVRFMLLIATILATAVLVTVAMFETLSLLVG